MRTDGTEILELENFLPYRLYRLADAVSREFSKIYRDRHGLTPARNGARFPDWDSAARMTATALGEQSAMHKTKVSRAVAELERRRWLTRTADENDRRVEHLTLTKAGLAAYREMVPLAKAFERELLEKLGVQRACSDREWSGGAGGGLGRRLANEGLHAGDSPLVLRDISPARGRSESR